MNTKIFNNSRVCPKGDIEANWNKAVGFVPLDKEIIIYKKDDTHSAARFKVGDGKTVVQDLPFSGTDIEAIQQLIDEKGELLIEYVDNAVTAIIEQLDQKLDKSGGLIDGDLSIQGNLNVTGTTTAKDTETIMVKDNVIVANSDGIELLENAGFAMKTSATAAYGIMYDPVGDGVKIGLGAIDENGKFNYTEGEDQFLATRADTIADGHTVVWDDENKTLVDSGVDHSEYVKRKDWATDEIGGVLRSVAAFGFNVDKYGRGQIVKAEKSDIDTATNEYKPIVPKMRDYFLMKALSDCKDTTLWTDDSTDENGEVIKGTKTKACETIGAIQNAQPSGRNYGDGCVLTFNSQGKLTYTPLFGIYIAGTSIPYRDSKGVLHANVPTTDTGLTPKKYVDDGFVPKQIPEFDAGATRGYAYVIEQEKNAETGEYEQFQKVKKIQIQANADTIPLRNANGNFYVGNPTLPYECVSKGYVDDGFVAKPGEAFNVTGIMRYNPTTGLVDRMPTYQGVPGNGQMPIAKTGGRITTNTPTEDLDCTNKAYVDGLIAELLARIEALEAK